MDTPNGAHTDAEAGASTFWLELFFDLVAVAAMVLLAAALEEHTDWLGVGLFTLTFVAIWTCWSSFALYVNLANEKVERRTMIAGMAAIAVMAAALLHLDEHANTFAIAFVLCRGFAERGSLRIGRVLTGVQLRLGAATLPWLVSLWVQTPWKYLLWALGLLLDLVGLVLQRRDAEELIARLNERAARDSRRDRRDRPSLVAADVRTDHLAERLGTFVIIVLGESVLQIVRAASEEEWVAPMWVASGAGFVVIVGIWRQTFAYGFTGAPTGGRAADRLGLTMLGHLVTTGSLVVLAAALGEFIRHATEPVERTWAWIGSGALAIYFAVALVTTLVKGGADTAGPPVRWIFGWSLPAIVAVVALATFGSGLHGWAFALLLMIPVGWQTSYLIAARSNPGGRPVDQPAGPAD